MEKIPCLDGLRAWTYGLYLVSSYDEVHKNALVVNTAIQVTADPAQIAVCINKNSFTREILLKSGKFAVMLLEEQAPLVFIGRFGFRSGRNYNKFEDLEFSVGKNGCPLILQHTLSAVEASVLHTVDLPTHTLFIGQVTDTQVFNPTGKPLTYEYYHNVLKGKTPLGATHLS